MPKRVVHLVFGNLRLKLWALLISVGIWFYAGSQVTEERTFRATLNISVPPDYAVVYQSENVGRVVLAGPRALVDRIQAELGQNPLQLSFALSDKEAARGWSILQVDAEWLRPRLPEQEYVQLGLREVAPAEVRVFVSPIKERTLPVTVRLAGAPPTGFRVVDTATASPAEVKVRGPAVAVDALNAVETTDLVLYGVQQSIAGRQLGLRSDIPVALDDGTHISVPVSLSPAAVVASVQIVGEEERAQTFENVPVLLLTPPGFAYVAEFAEDEDAVAVVVRASPANLKKLKPGSIKAYVDLERLSEERIEPGASAPYKEKVLLSLPEDVTYSSALSRPDRVTLLLKNPAK